MPVVAGPTEERDLSRVEVGRETTGGADRASKDVVEMESFLADETSSVSGEEGVSTERFAKGVLDREPMSEGVEARCDEPRSSMPTIERDLVRRRPRGSSVLGPDEEPWRLWFLDPFVRSCCGPGDVGRELVYE
jgi:hypothetical protein